MTKTSMLDYDQLARMKGDLKHFLKPFFTFRVYAVFTANRKKCHFYGNEHQCTYSQVQHGHVPFIQLDREKGYRDLLDLVEKKWKGKLLSAAIYQREDGAEKFEHLCRRYYQGEIQEVNDPVINDADRIRRVHFKFEAKNLVLSLQPFELPNFKTEIDNHLLKAETV